MGLKILKEWVPSIPLIPALGSTESINSTHSGLCGPPGLV